MQDSVNVMTSTESVHIEAHNKTSGMYCIPADCDLLISYFTLEGKLCLNSLLV
jgi:hypothetical protein